MWGTLVEYLESKSILDPSCLLNPASLLTPVRVSVSLYPIFYILYLVPYTLCLWEPTTSALRHIPSTLQPLPYVIYLVPYTLYVIYCSLIHFPPALFFMRTWNQSVSHTTSRNNPHRYQYLLFASPVRCPLYPFYICCPLYPFHCYLPPLHEVPSNLFPGTLFLAPFLFIPSCAVFFLAARASLISTFPGVTPQRRPLFLLLKNLALCRRPSLLQASTAVLCFYRSPPPPRYSRKRPPPKVSK